MHMYTYTHVDHGQRHIALEIVEQIRLIPLHTLAHTQPVPLTLFAHIDDVLRPPFSKHTRHNERTRGHKKKALRPKSRPFSNRGVSVEKGIKFFGEI